MIEEQLRRGGVLAEDGDARVRRQMELRAADRNRLAQARGQPRHALADRFAIRTLEHQREQALAQLPEVPPGLAVPLVRFGRQTQDRRAHDLLGDLGGDDLRDVADTVELDDGDRERPLAQRRHRHRLLATSEEAAAVELGKGPLVAPLERVVPRACRGLPDDAQRALRTPGAGACLIGDAVVLQARFRRGAQRQRPAHEQLQELRDGRRPETLDPLAGRIQAAAKARHAVSSAAFQHQAVPSDQDDEIGQSFDQCISAHAGRRFRIATELRAILRTRRPGSRRCTSRQRSAL